MNEARQLYLKSYFRVDSLDSSLEKCKMYYRSWKYWHMAMLHAKKIAITVAYSLYIEATEGNLDPAWKVESPLTFFDFRDKISKQMLEYNPEDLLYPGDQHMCAVTILPKNRRKRKPGRPKSSEISPDFVSKEDLCVEIKEKRESERRLCGDLTLLSDHIDSTEKKKNGGICAWCKETAYTKCTKCGVYLHFFPQRGRVESKRKCFINHHNDSMFGLSAKDQPLVGKRKKDWKDPSNRKVKRNRAHISNLKKDI